MAKIIGVKVTGLLGQFNHVVNFPADSPFVILHGPNGVGKTHILRILNAVLSGELWRLRRIPFHTARLSFEDGSWIGVTRTEAVHSRVHFGDNAINRLSSPEEAAIRREFLRSERFSDVELSIAYGHSYVTSSFGLIDISQTELPTTVRALARSLLSARQISDSEWQREGRESSLTNDEVVSLLISEYPEFASEVWSMAYDLPNDSWSYVQKNPVSLIETQRLLPENWPHVHVQGNKGAVSKIAEISRYMKNHCEEVLAENSRISQKLDRKFPFRVLERRHEDPASLRSLRKRHKRQLEMRTALAELALSEELPDEIDSELLIDSQLNPTERNMMDIYLDDGEEKLAVFTPLMRRVSLMLGSLNSKFLNKHARFNAREGFIFESYDGSPIDPELLSSGEQHELVLLHEFLFRTEAGSIVLVDEPEISLHVQWQRNFVEDLIAISKLVGFQFIIATHSPQIVDRWIDEAVFLDPRGN